MKRVTTSLLFVFVILIITGCKTGDIIAEKLNPNLKYERIAKEQREREEKRELERWDKAGFSKEEASKWKNINFSSELAKEWKKLGCSAIEAKEWKDANYSINEVEEWKKVGVILSEAEKLTITGDFSINHIKKVKDFKEAEFTIDEIVIWTKLKRYSRGYKGAFDTSEYKVSDLKIWKDTGLTVSEAEDWSKRGYGPKSTTHALKKAKANEKVKKSGAKSLNKEECELLTATMIMRKNGKSICNYKELEWSDIKLCSVHLKKAWRAKGFTPFVVKQWTDAGVIFPSIDYADLYGSRNVGADYKEMIQIRNSVGEGCKKELNRYKIVYTNDYVRGAANYWTTPNTAKKLLQIGLFDETVYVSWVNKGFSDYEIDGWVKRGLDNPTDAEKLKAFGMTLDNVERYINAGVTLENMNDYKGMTLEEIEAEKAEADAQYAQQRKLENQKKAQKDAVTRKQMLVMKPGKTYSCQDMYKINIGNNTVSLTGISLFTLGTRIEANFSDSTKSTKKFTGAATDNKYGSEIATVEIVTDLNEAKEQLSNIKISSQSNKFVMQGSYICK